MEISQALRRLDPRILLTLAGIVIVALIAAVAQFAPPGVDWSVVFRPAARELLALRNPYDVTGFYNPVWTLLPMLPLALLPERIGRAALLVAGVTAFGYTAYRLGASPLTMAAFLLSPPVLHNLLNSNVEWMVLLGFVLPPQIGLFLVLIKPQTGFAVALFWLIEALRTNGLREAVRIFWPVTATMLLTFALFGLWPLRAQDGQNAVSLLWNFSQWPFSIPVGLTLLVVALRRRNIRFAMPASPCLSPYVALHSWSAALAPLVASQPEFLVAFVGLWLIVLIRAGFLPF